MAYLDKGQLRPNATSIGGALAINGLMIAGIIFAAPDMLPKEPWKIIDTYWVQPEPVPTPPTEIEQPVTKAATKSLFVPLKQPIAPQSEDGAITTTKIGTGTDGGTGTAFIDEPPIKVDPVLTGARINPRYAGALQPTYPPGMIREEREGVVTVRVLIGTDGRVKAVEPVKAEEGAFLEATRKQALSKWRFLPATRDGAPVESWREMTVRFQLPD